MNLNVLHRRLMQDVLEIEITDLRMWALAWAEDIVRRTIADTYEEDESF